MDQQDLNQQLLETIHNGSYRNVKGLIEQGADITASIGPNGETGLHLIIGCTREVKYLDGLEAAINCVDNDGNTPMHKAASIRNFEAIEWLKSKGGFLNSINNYNQNVLHVTAYSRPILVNENDPFVIALLEERVNFIKFLVDQGADLNIQDNNGQTVLHITQGYNDIELVKFLVEKGANMHARNMDGATVLHKAIEQEQNELATFFIENGIDVNIPQNNGTTALHLATSDSNLDLVKMLFEHGANLDVVDMNGFTSLHFAIQGHQGNEISEFLLENGADPNITFQGLTPMDTAVQVDNPSRVLLLYSVTDEKEIGTAYLLHYFANKDDIEELLKQGNVQQKIISGFTILEKLRENNINSNASIKIERALLDIIYEATPSIFKPCKISMDSLILDEVKLEALEGLEEKIQDFNKESMPYKALNFLHEIQANREILKNAKMEILSHSLQLQLNLSEEAKIQTFLEKGVIGNIASFAETQDLKALYLTGRSEVGKNWIQEEG